MNIIKTNKILILLMLFSFLSIGHTDELTNNVHNVEKTSINSSSKDKSSIVFKKDQRKRRRGKNSEVPMSKKDSYRFDSFIKSFALPGWGEYDLGNRNEAVFFLSTEIALIAASVSLYFYSDAKEDDFKDFAERHAGINSANGKDELYWINIGNYDNIDEYNEQKVRNRQYGSRYLDESDYWNWDSTRNKKRFDDIRIMSSTAETMSLYAVGLIAANHLLSAINASFEASKKFDTKVSAIYNDENNEIVNKLSLTYKF